MSVRPATPEDIPELVRLRVILADRMAQDGSYPIGERWQEDYADSLEERLGSDDTAVYVVDAPAGGLAACGIGLIFDRFPGPTLPDGRCGYIQGMATDPAHRRRGHGRAIMSALLDWYRDGEVQRVDLHATSDAEPLYRELGFVDDGYPSLTWRHPS
ncbi:GNAT superfamily N-acetyltransferase [Streptosporangium album]|uniref:GNAT superfamily N-acetyltransferase n=1 Tax=Streptosporangium album TaxID=47479 RepID=A0A7W7RTA8_9ACTN|nr:GNAT family N-acetyltransferase [Streptosporangium album]MBB4937507.1 GNAT superfamily N-acetyltransferase [Streptosporangium album]